jgi:hypothetical protein
MSISTLGSVEGRSVFTEVLHGRVLGEGPYTDLQIRAGGLGDDTRKISLQVYDGATYAEQLAINRRGLNIVNMVIRDSIIFDTEESDLTGGTTTNRAGSITSRRDGDRAEIAFELAGEGPGKSISFNSVNGAEFDAPAHFNGILRARDLRVRGRGATFEDDGVEAALIRAVRGAMAFDGLHVGDADLRAVRAKRIDVDGDMIVRKRLLLPSSTIQGAPAWSVGVSNGSTSGVVPDLVLDGRGAFVVRNCDDREASMEVAEGNVVVREAVCAKRVVVQTAHVKDMLRANHVHVRSARVEGDLVAAEATIASAQIESAHVTSQLRAKSIVVDRDVVAQQAVRAVALHAAREVSAPMVNATDGAFRRGVVTGVLRADRVETAMLAAPSDGTHAVVVAGARGLVADRLSAARVETDRLDVRDAALRMSIGAGEIRINGERALALTEGRLHVPFAACDALVAARSVVAPLARVRTIEAFGGADTGNVDLRAHGLTLGHLRLGHDASIRVVDGEDHNGVLDLIARNGAVIRAGATQLGSFEAPMWQVIKGQGVRQVGSQYLITPDSGRYVKMQPPSQTDAFFTIFVNTTGQSLIAFETSPMFTRVPKTLLIGQPDESDDETKALIVRRVAMYHGPLAVFHSMSTTADAEVRVKATSEVASVSFETATGLVRIEHRSDVHKLAFANDETGNDFLTVDTITGLTWVTGDLQVDGSLMFGTAVGIGGAGKAMTVAMPMRLPLGVLDLGNVEFRAEGDDLRALRIGAASVSTPVVFAPSFAITRPVDGSVTRRFGFNCYTNTIGQLRHLNNGSAVALGHAVRQIGESTTSSLTIGFSPRRMLGEEIAEVETALEVSETGQLHLRNVLDGGRLDMLQDTLRQQVRFETTRGSYSFDQTVELNGDLRVKQVVGADVSRYHALRSTDDGLLVTPNSETPTGGGVQGVPAAVVLSEGGVQWRMRISPETGDLVFEHQRAAGAAWSSAFRMVAER